MRWTLWFGRLPTVANLKAKEKYHLGTKLDNEPLQLEDGSCECGGKFTAVNEYAVKYFPPLLELRFLWAAHPDVSTFGDCDVPRTIRWGETEYDFVAAILFRPGHWSTRVFYQDKLYSGQSTDQDWGPWLMPVEETGWNTTKVAWKMTPQSLNGSYPVRLFFARRPRDNIRRDQNLPEGKWFRLDDEPLSTSDGVERDLRSASNGDIPIKPSESIPSANQPRQTPPPPTTVDEITNSDRPQRQGRTRLPRRSIPESPAARKTTKSDAQTTSPHPPKFQAVNSKDTAGTPSRERKSFQPIPASPTPANLPSNTIVEDEIIVAPLKSLGDATPLSSPRPGQPQKGKRPAAEPEVEWVMDVSSPNKKRRGRHSQTQKELSRSTRK